jgi:hypothetical protein
MVRYLSNPPPGSKAFAAREYGIDLTLLAENLKLTPTQRLQKGMAAGRFHEQLREAGRRQG